MTLATATIEALWRHPIKGFTPEPVAETLLSDGDFFPHDRLYAMEVGPSGFDEDNPKTISKMKFAVLARFPAVARLRTRYDEIAGSFHIADASGTWDFDLTSVAGRNSLARHVEARLAAHEDYDPVLQPLNVLESPSYEHTKTHFRFTDSGRGFVSFLNLNSLRDLGSRLERDLDPLRMRANIWLEGLNAFEDHNWVGRQIRVGDDGPEFEVLKPIVRCVATHVNPDTAERDVDLCTALWENYGHRDCGIYARITKGGSIRPGDKVHVF
ncbi:MULTISPECIES: MOSC domain-containing protein [Asticcacaulis]|uniref:MOSC domain-containing protein n=1 Tax=Asticcacaulis TaxID=76890 RepID=UPI001AE37E70|nr:MULTISPECIES: MOSC domain-containing protein [Asticcacaulis]MBP2159489.1 uncharacterized protein YcbX [Asticcacaulis solisilvae]MDR6800684.1 uncharacterized protein YcbX [Asticcacaulis sp. BE141]